MKVILEPEAKEDLQGHVAQGHRRYVRDKLQQLEENPTSQQDTDTIKIRGRTVFKYVMKQGSKGGKDYRAVFDIIDGEVKVVAIFHRDEGYNKQMINQRL